jgi:hypothetical protein
VTGNRDRVHLIGSISYLEKDTFESRVGKGGRIGRMGRMGKIRRKDKCSYTLEMLPISRVCRNTRIGEGGKMGKFLGIFD